MGIRSKLKLVAIAHAALYFAGCNAKGAISVVLQTSSSPTELRTIIFSGIWFPYLLTWLIIRMPLVLQFLVRSATDPHQAMLGFSMSVVEVVEGEQACIMVIADDLNKALWVPFLSR